jgi:hypothetical protein
MQEAIRTMAVAASCLFCAATCVGQQLVNDALAITVSAQDGAYHLATRADPNHAVLTASVGAQVDHHWVRSTDYPQHRGAESVFADTLGSGRQIAVTCTWLPGKPDLVYSVQLYADFTVQLTADGLDGIPERQSFPVHVSAVTGVPDDLSRNRRYVEPDKH